MTKVMHLIGSLETGGAERVALDLCRILDPAEIQQAFVCLSGQRGGLATEFETAGARVETLSIRAIPSFVIHLRRIVRDVRPDVVVSHVSLTSGPLLFLVTCWGVPRRIARLHSEGDGRPSSLRRLLYRSVCRLLLAICATHILSVSEASLRFGIGKHARIGSWVGTTMRVQPNGIDTKRYRPPVSPCRGDGVLRIIHVGRSSPEKNRAALVPIFEAVEDLVPATMRVVGPGNSSDLGPSIPAAVDVIGETSEVAGLLASADVLLLPSKREGLPGVLLEALATGLPVVATDLPTLRELQTALHGITLISPDAAPGVWARAVIQAAHDADNVEIRKTIESSDFELTRVASQWRELWLSV